MGALIAFTSRSSATTVELHDGVLAINDPDGVANVLNVRQLSLVEFDVYDEAGGLVSGVGCGSLTDQVARCAGQVLSVRVNAGEGDDLLGLWSLRMPVEIMGGEGADALAGGRGPDQLQGGPGDDSLSGYVGDDRIAAEDGRDFADGDAGADAILGGIGDDILGGGEGNGDLVTGGEGEDLVYGGLGSDDLQGGAGDDTLIGGKGRDAIGTGLGSDDVFGGGGKINQIDCREGDRARGQAGRLPRGCRPLPASERQPDVWPPVASPSARQSQVPLYRVFAKPVRPGDAHRYWLWAGAAEDVSRKVRIKLTFRRGQRILSRRCVSNVWTNKKVWRKVPKKARAAIAVTGRVRRGKSCP